jgi:hypothetical protein
MKKLTAVLTVPLDLPDAMRSVIGASQLMRFCLSLAIGIAIIIQDIVLNWGTAR